MNQAVSGDSNYHTFDEGFLCSNTRTLSWQDSTTSTLSIQSLKNRALINPLLEARESQENIICVQYATRVSISNNVGLHTNFLPTLHHLFPVVPLNLSALLIFTRLPIEIAKQPTVRRKRFLHRLKNPLVVSKNQEVTILLNFRLRQPEDRRLLLKNKHFRHSMKHQWLLVKMLKILLPRRTEMMGMKPW